MASHVVVIDSTARRHTIKTSPAKHLSDVLQEACAKFGLNPDQYGLKHNNKPVDLSRTIRLSGLSSGAKLNLVQASRSPSVVSVALQLPAPNVATGNNTRLTDKFASNTPLWQILRRFESGVAGGDATKQANLNLTQRATPLMVNGDGSGAGRLCYEMPIVNIMGRELSTLADLQKTLGQLGYTNGSAMMRINFRATQQPLEEAMTEISKYFQAVEEPAPTGSLDGAHASGPSDLRSGPTIDDASPLEAISPQFEPGTSESTPLSAEEPNAQAADTASEPSSTNTNTSNVSSLTIFAPPITTVPAAASPMTPYNEDDYIPTIDHAKRHQARLNGESRNRKLLSDKELANQAQARSEQLSSVTSVTVRFRFPDQTQAQRDFGQDATTANLYTVCRELMDRPNDEDFSVRSAGQGGATTTLAEGRQRLIRDLTWHGRVLVVVAWGDGVSVETKRRPCLKEAYRLQAEELKIEFPRKEEVQESRSLATDLKDQTGRENEKRGGGEDKEARMKRLLGKLSKK